MVDFARALGSVRHTSELTYRQIAAATNYSHAPMVRATRGQTLPTWPVAKAFLTACGVENRSSWRRLWINARDAQQAFELGIKGAPVTGADLAGEMRPKRTGPERTGEPSQDVMNAVRESKLLVGSLRKVWTTEQLGRALGRLRRRSGRGSLRKMQDLTGIPRATLAGWCNGTRKPNAERLDQLVTAPRRHNDRAARVLSGPGTPARSPGLAPAKAVPIVCGGQSRGKRRL